MAVLTTNDASRIDARHLEVFERVERTFAWRFNRALIRTAIDLVRAYGGVDIRIAPSWAIATFLPDAPDAHAAYGRVLGPATIYVDEALPAACRGPLIAREFARYLVEASCIATSDRADREGLVRRVAALILEKLREAAEGPGIVRAAPLDPLDLEKVQQRA